jgi:hypothetical protein
MPVHSWPFRQTIRFRRALVEGAHEKGPASPPGLSRRLRIA